MNMQLSSIFSLNNLVVSVILIAVLLIYFKIAVKYKIIDKPNQRSSHIKPTIRGGGIIFPITVIFFGLLNGFELPYFIIAVVLSGIISFIDDVMDLPSGLRFGIHILAAVLLLYEANILSIPVVLMICAFIFVVGVMNAFNFMDGINGITGFYSLAIVVPLMLTESDALIFKLESLILLALLIFLFFNARKKAVCFAGDVGSVTIAVIICFLITQRIIATNDYTYLAFLTLYLVDTGLTIIQRLKNRERVLEAHRKHLFQVLSNELGNSHLKVTLIYAFLQLAINLFVINTDIGVPGLVVLFAIAVATYIIIKIRVLKIAS